MSKQITLESFVRDECSYLFSDECHGSFSGKCLNGDVNGGREKRESQTAVIYQYPYEFIYPNSGLCWIEEGTSCDYIESRFLRATKNIRYDGSVGNEDKELCKSAESQKTRYCGCGATLSKGRQCCDICKIKNRQKTNRENQRKQRAKSNTIL